MQVGYLPPLEQPGLSLWRNQTPQEITTRFVGQVFSLSSVVDLVRSAPPDDLQQDPPVGEEDENKGWYLVLS